MPKKLSKVQNAIRIDSEDGSVGRLDISGEVGWDWYGDAWDSGYFKIQMDDLGDVERLAVHINSPGGSVIDGIAIFNYLRQHPATVDVHIDGVAASIASVIAMAGDKIYMPSNTMMFIHEPWMYTAGNADDLRKDADTLETMQSALMASYQRHFKGTDEQISAMMKEEVWLTAAEASEKFNNIEIVKDEVKIAASLDMSKLGDIPDQAKAFLAEEEGISSSFGTKLLAFLKGEGFAQATEEPGAGDSINMKPMEEEMTPEEKAALAKEIQEGVMATLKEAGVIQAKKTEPEAKAVEVEFVGCKTNPEDVQAHLEKVQLAQLENSVDWNDPKSVQAYHAALAPKAPSAGKLPAGNVTEPDTTSAKAQNQKDTVAFIDNLIK